MNIDLTDEAQEYGRTAERAIEAAGGDALVQRAEADPARRGDAAAVLGELGAWDLDPLGSDDELEAAAALCRAAGRWAVPYPVAERLSRPGDLHVDGLVVVAGPAPEAPLAGLDLRWATIDLDGRCGMATPRPLSVPARKAAFVTGLDLEPLDEGGSPAAVALGLVLGCWTLLGMLDRAMELTRAYVVERHQFGQPLSRFQGVQFQLTDAEVERAGVEELAGYALWSIEGQRPDAVEDALALRLAAVEAAEVVFRTCHQLHGAIGFCDETALSWLSRYSQPLRRLPLGAAATRDELSRRLGRRPLAGLFDGTGAGW